MELPEIGHRWIWGCDDIEPVLVAQLVQCWLDVSNAGGAVGFPFPPVSESDVVFAVEELLTSLDPTGRRILVALREDRLVGWLVLELNSSPLTSHWGRVLRVQTTPDARRTGVGRALMEEVARAAGEDLTLEQLHLELRSGQGLEPFYESCGWREVGRWPRALRLSQADSRDEVLMVLELGAPPRT